jgi:hypothetical protein
MNERIRQLAEQATTSEVICGRGFDTTQYTEHFSKEKFAELIVQECMKINRDILCEDDPDYLDKIYKEHFGVEE